MRFDAKSHSRMRRFPATLVGAITLGIVGLAGPAQAESPGAFRFAGR